MTESPPTNSLRKTSRSAETSTSKRVGTVVWRVARIVLVAYLAVTLFQFCHFLLLGTCQLFLA